MANEVERKEDGEETLAKHPLEHRCVDRKRSEGGSDERTGGPKDASNERMRRVPVTKEVGPGTDARMGWKRQETDPCTLRSFRTKHGR